MTKKFLVPVQLPADPVNPLEAATKQYVDGNYIAMASSGISLPTVTGNGQIAGDSAGKVIWVWDSAAARWFPAIGNIVCTSSTRPSIPATGTIIYETDTGKSYIYQTSPANAWQPITSGGGAAGLDASGGVEFNTPSNVTTGFTQQATAATIDPNTPLTGGFTLAPQGLTVPMTGVYVVEATVAFATGTSGAARKGIGISVSPTGKPERESIIGNQTNASQTTVATFVMPLTAGQTLYLFRYVDQVTAVTTATGKIRAVLISGSASGEPVNSDAGWVPFTYQNGYADYSAASYTNGSYRKKDGIVYLQGLIRCGTAVANGTVITNLPVGFRPGFITHHSVAAATNDFVRININAGAAGNIQINYQKTALVASTSWISLDGISFPADG